MKTLARILFLSLIIINFSCSDDDDDGGPAYEFTNQNLQGQINGKSWSFVEGVAEVSPFDDTKLSIELGAEELESPCDLFALSGLRVFFSIPHEVALTELNFSLEEGGQTVTLFDPDGTLNIIATEGAVEILTITDTEVTGRIDAREGGGGEDGVNGNFSVTYCSE
ncbi:MAG: hypothetical protein ABJF11_09725 [Reichenbachiella sp.]|uniref:hypothetical protein n=1 Tax=Reichenbachiella sp. TaxID=2184521 RepID=UPI003266A5FB